MSAAPFTLQCYRCAGFFRADAEPRSRVKCPHCAWIAQADEFRRVGSDELGSTEPTQAAPAAAGVDVGNGAWVQKGKYLQFGCPHCERPMRMVLEEAGGLADCPHCGLEIVSPDPNAGSAARLSDASQRRMGQVGRGAIKAKSLRLQPRKVSTEEAPSLDEAEQVLATTATEPEAQPDAPNPFSAATAAAATPSPRAAPVRMMGVEQLGAAFQAREEMEVPDPLGWDEGGGERAEDKVFNDRRGKIFAYVGAALLCVLGITFIVLEFKRRGEAVRETQAEEARVLAETQAVEARLDKAFGVAQKAAGAASWREAVPHIRSRERVLPVMERYYRTHDYQQVRLTKRDFSTETKAGEIQYLQLRATDSEGLDRLVALEETADGEFLFDWELWVDIAKVEWENFLEERPVTPTPVRVTIARGAALPRYAEDAGLDDADGVRCMRIWLNDSGASLFAVFPKSDPTASAVWETMAWDLGRRVIAELSFPQGAAQPDRVVVHRVVQARWLQE